MTSEKDAPPQVAAAIVAAMRAVTGVGKNGHNGEQNFKYRKYDDILSVAHDALVEAGLAILPDVVDMKQRTVDVVTKNGYNRTVTTTVVRVEYTFIAAADASERTFTFYGEASDYGDKSLGKALSYADKMMLIGVLKIPVASDDIDPDQHSHADDEPVARTQRSRTERPGQVREPKASTAAARRGAAQARAAIRQAPAPAAPPAESDDALHADVIERLAVISDEPGADHAQATLERIWGDVERARVERNAWAVADYNAIKQHVRDIGASIKAATEARAAATAAELATTRLEAGDLDPWSEDPRERAEARAVIDAAQGRTPAVFAGPGNQSGHATALIDVPPAAAAPGNPDARA
jgi:hypothetical protein